MEFTGDAELAMFGYELGTQAASQIDLVGWLQGEEFDLVPRESRAPERKAPPHGNQAQQAVAAGHLPLERQRSETVPSPNALVRSSGVTVSRHFSASYSGPIPNLPAFTAAWGACFVFSAVPLVAVPRVGHAPSC
jgi:hypothetical protein